MVSNRRSILAAGASLTSIGAITGCIGRFTGEEQGTATAGNDAVHDIELEAGDIIRIEIETEEGVGGDVLIEDPESSEVLNMAVQHEVTITHETENTGIYTIQIIADERISYEIHID